jgi:DNA transformation protein and related proteins
MAPQSEFMNNVLEILSPLGDVTTKRMFGGYGIFLDARMFALVNKAEELYLKADDQNRQAFIEQGSETYGKMPYYAAPPEALEGWSQMQSWAEGAVAASVRATKK